MTRQRKRSTGPVFQASEASKAAAQPSVVQAPRFGKSKRKLAPKAQLATDNAVREILKDPLAGEPKVGALKGVRVVKFKLGPLQLLLAYQFKEKGNVVVLHEMTHAPLNEIELNRRP